MGEQTTANREKCERHCFAKGFHQPAKQPTNDVGGRFTSRSHRYHTITHPITHTCHLCDRGTIYKPVHSQARSHPIRRTLQANVRVNGKGNGVNATHAFTCSCGELRPRWASDIYPCPSPLPPCHNHLISSLIASNSSRVPSASILPSLRTIM